MYSSLFSIHNSAAALLPITCQLFDAYRKNQLATLWFKPESPLRYLDFQADTLPTHLILAAEEDPYPQPAAWYALIAPCLLPDQPLHQDLHEPLLQLLLHWLIEQLRPQSAPDNQNVDWQNYNLLLYFYQQRASALTVATQLGCGEATFYRWRERALTLVSKLLGQLFAPITASHVQSDSSLSSDDQVRLRCAFQAVVRYHLFPAVTQRVCHWLTCFRQPIDPVVLQAWWESMNQQPLLTECIRPICTASIDLGATLRQLQTIGWFVASNQHSAAGFLRWPEDLRNWVTRVEEEETARHIKEGHRIAACYFTAHTQPLEAAWHLWQADDYQAALKLVMVQHQTIVKLPNTMHEQAIVLDRLLEEFQQKPAAIGYLEAQIQQMAGEIAETRQDLTSALTKYEQALVMQETATRPTDRYRQAELYYKLARLFETQDVAKALENFNRAIQWLEQYKLEPLLLARAYFYRAWVYLRFLPDDRKAAADLKRAAVCLSVIDAEQAQDLRYKLSNAWSRYWINQGKQQKALEELFRALQFAESTGNQEGEMEILHNLGQEFRENGDQERAQQYLRQSLALAQSLGIEWMQGVCERTLGGCYFYLQRYTDAIVAYQRALAIFVKTHRRDVQAYTHYDLAEAYAELGDVTAAKHHWYTGFQIATTGGIVDIAQQFNQLVTVYPWIAQAKEQQHPRLEKMLRLLYYNGTLSNLDYRQTTGLSAKQAERDLKQWVSAGILRRVGEGRGVYYERNR